MPVQPFLRQLPWCVCWCTPFVSHANCVVQVDELQRSLAFISISTDGDVLLWTLAKCELVPERLIHLQPPPHQKSCAAAAGPGFAASSAVAAADELLPQQQVDGGLCMDFKKVCCPCLMRVFAPNSWATGFGYQAGPQRLPSRVCGPSHLTTGCSYAAFKALEFHAAAWSDANQTGSQHPANTHAIAALRSLHWKCAWHALKHKLGRSAA